MPQSSIHYLANKEINRRLWDACIDNASNGLIYAYSVYLDAMTDDWDGLVLNNYEAVMPLPWRKKYGVYYLYQPAFVAQLGLLGTDVSSGLLEAFLKAIPKKFRYWDFVLNHNNLFVIENYPLYERNNFVLSLNKPYNDLYNQYRENIQRNIKKAKNYGCFVQTNIDVAQIIDLARQQSQQSGTAEEDYQTFAKLYQQLQASGQAMSYGVYSAQQQLLASCVFFFSHKRAYYILVGNHPNGRTLGASHALIDAFVKDYAGKELLLDFEGSDIRNLAFFYSSFGAREEKYAAVRYNRLPWYARWLRK